MVIQTKPFWRQPIQSSYCFAHTQTQHQLSTILCCIRKHKTVLSMCVCILHFIIFFCFFFRNLWLWNSEKRQAKRFTAIVISFVFAIVKFSVLNQQKFHRKLKILSFYSSLSLFKFLLLLLLFIVKLVHIDTTRL